MSSAASCAAIARRGEQAAGIDQHRGERADAGAGLLVGGGDGELAQRGDVERDLALDPALHPRAQPGAALGRQAVERARGAHRGLEQGAAGGEAGEDVAVPADREAAGLLDQAEVGVGGVAQLGGAAVELVAEAALGGGEEQALVGEAGGRVDLEVEARRDGRSARARR